MLLTVPFGLGAGLGQLRSYYRDRPENPRADLVSEPSAAPPRTEPRATVTNPPPPASPKAAEVILAKVPQIADGPAKFRYQRLHRQTAEDLRGELLAVPQLDLESTPQATANLLTEARFSQRRLTHPALGPLTQRPDLRGLPLALGDECQLPEEAATHLQELSRELRKEISASAGNAERLARELLPARWCQEEAVPTLVQMLQAESAPLRMLLVDLLCQTPGQAATVALARRALFDLHPQIREAAVRGLVGRTRTTYQDVLVDGLRYPWPPVTEHAAEALVALQAREVVPRLAALKEQLDRGSLTQESYRAVNPGRLFNPNSRGTPDPTEVSLIGVKSLGSPFESFLVDSSLIPSWVYRGSGEVYVVRELAAINHSGNCLLCHAVSQSARDPVRGLVTPPGQTSPSSGSAEYYDHQQIPARPDLFVRADITYLRQDFSVPQHVASRRSGPSEQRYDYFVRTRYPTRTERDAKAQQESRQRRAVRFALRELAG